MDIDGPTGPPPIDDAQASPPSDAWMPTLGPFQRAGLALIPFLVLAAALWAIRLPYFVLAPGPAQEVEPLITVTGHPTYHSPGHLLLTDVVFYKPNTFEAVAAAVNPDDHVVREDELLPAGQNQAQYIRQGFSQMDTSKIDATIVALTKEAGYPKNHGPGVLIESVLPDAPATNKLFAGDLVTRVNGQLVTSVSQVSAVIQRAGYGGTVVFTVRAGGRVRTVRVSPTHLKVEVAPGKFETRPYPAIGVSMVANFPFDVEISSEGIGGPSAGLMWTLGLIDLLTPGDLAGGRIIAGTGEIAPDGQVLPIGGVEQKVAAAETAHATVFFVPVANADDAASVAHGITLVPVRTYTDALDWLQAHPPGTVSGR
jgi:PDZ domain-containing protein